MANSTVTQTCPHCHGCGMILPSGEPYDHSKRSHQEKGLECPVCGTRGILETTFHLKIRHPHDPEGVYDLVGISAEAASALLEKGNLDHHKSFPLAEGVETLVVKGYSEVRNIGKEEVIVHFLLPIYLSESLSDIVFPHRASVPVWKDGAYIPGDPILYWDWSEFKYKIVK